MARRRKRNNVDLVLYGDAGFPALSQDDVPGTLFLNELTGTLYIRRQDMSLMPVNAANRTSMQSGTATILSGNTSVVVDHGLSITPTLADISVIAGEDPTNSVGLIWVDTITASQFTIHCEADPGASNLDLGWRAVVL